MYSISGPDRMDITFERAVVISAVIHAALLLHFAKVDISKNPVERTKPVVVDYVIMKKALPRTPETPRAAVAQKVELRPSEQPQRAGAAKNAKDVQGPKHEELKGTKDYINYYQLIREKIRRSIKARYKDRARQGDVYLTFTLRSDGSLVSVETDSAHSSGDAALVEMAKAGMRDASPFPRFPQALNLPSLRLNLIVSFKSE